MIVVNSSFDHGESLSSSPKLSMSITIAKILLGDDDNAGEQNIDTFIYKNVEK